MDISNQGLCVIGKGRANRRMATGTTCSRCWWKSSCSAKHGEATSRRVGSSCCV